MMMMMMMISTLSEYHWENRERVIRIGRRDRGPVSVHSMIDGDDRRQQRFQNRGGTFFHCLSMVVVWCEVPLLRQKVTVAVSFSCRVLS